MKFEEVKQIEGLGISVHKKINLNRNYCKNCGESLRGLFNAPEIPVHEHNSSRFCDGTGLSKPTQFAEWNN